MHDTAPDFDDIRIAAEEDGHFDAADTFEFRGKPLQTSKKHFDLVRLINAGYFPPDASPQVVEDAEGQPQVVARWPEDQMALTVIYVCTQDALQLARRFRRDQDDVYDERLGFCDEHGLGPDEIALELVPLAGEIWEGWQSPADITPAAPVGDGKKNG